MFILANGVGVVGGEGAKGGSGAGNALLFRICQGIVKVQDILGNFFFEKGFGEVLEAGIFGYSMAKEPGKGDTGGKYEGKSRNDKGFLPGMDLFFEGGKHGGSSLPEGFLLYY